MSSNLNEVLADCERQAQQLTKEIAKYQAAGAISEQVEGRDATTSGQATNI